MDCVQSWLLPWKRAQLHARAASLAMVLVCDGVFTPATCALLHTVAMARSSSFERGNSLLFTRSEPKNIMEAAIDSFLDETDDESCIVEYWARQEWKNIEAHVDIDEERARFKRPFRHPKRAHVCYLAVGRRVRAPTCVWERTPLDDFPFGALTSVPAVAGRVLRFDGSLQHAVPYPTQIWLHSNAAAPVCDAPEELVRSVLLFNTWDKPPLGRSYAPSDERFDLSPTRVGLRCVPREDWSLASISSHAAPEDGTMTLTLLGDAQRRGRAEKVLPLRVSRTALAKALEETSVATRLEPPPVDAQIRQATRLEPRPSKRTVVNAQATAAAAAAAPFTVAAPFTAAAPFTRGWEAPPSFQRTACPTAGMDVLRSRSEVQSPSSEIQTGMDVLRSRSEVQSPSSEIRWVEGRDVVGVTPLLSSMLTKRILDAVQADDFVNVWVTDRHKLHPTTDVEVVQVPWLEAEMGTVLRAQLLPAFARLFGVDEQQLFLRDQFVVRYAILMSSDCLLIGMECHRVRLSATWCHRVRLSATGGI